MSSNRPGRWFRRLIVTLVVLAVLAIVVDRVAAIVAQNQLASMADTEAKQYHVRSADTSVKIGGFGFFPQLVKEDFSKVTLTMGKPTFSGVPAEDLKVELHDVHVPHSLLTSQSGAVTIDTSDLQLRLSPRELSRLAVVSTGLQGLSLAVVGGKLHAKLSISGFNADVPIVPQLQDGHIALAVGQLPDSIPSAVQNALKNQLTKGITIPEMPFGAQLTGVNVVDNAIVITAAAKNVNFKA